MGRKSVQKRRYVDPLIRDHYTAKLLVYFQKNGIRNFAMSGLAKDFGISKTTLYNHFSSKEDMIEAAIIYKLNSIQDYKSVLFDKDLSYYERLRKALLFYCVQIFQLSRKLLIEVEQDYPRLWLKVLKFQQNVLKDLLAYYKLGQRIGHYNLDVDPYLIVCNDQYFFEMLSKGNLPKKYEEDIVEVVNQYCKIKFSGLLNQGV